MTKLFDIFYRLNVIGSASRSYLYYKANADQPTGTVYYPFEINSVREFCVEFYYHMSGAGIGSLEVEIMSQAGLNKIFEQRGDQGNVWHRFQRMINHDGSKRSYVVSLS